MNDSIISFNPIIKKANDADIFRYISGMNVEIDPPANAPTRLAITRAIDEPKKTARGLFEFPLKVNVANCVLSPNSAINTVKNVEIRRFKIIYIFTIRTL